MRYRRTFTIAALLAFGLTASGCSSFDPTEWFNTKKPLPGDRKPMFPQGVPGVAQGVPAELVEGYKPAPEPVPEPKVVEEKPKPKPRPQPKLAAKPKPQPAPVQAAAPLRPTTTAGTAPQGAQAPWPDAPPAPPPSQSQSVFPDPPRTAR
jgi:hypothetical protein